MATIKDLAEQYGLEDYEQLLGGYPNATKFANALQSNIESHIPTTEDLQSPERMGEWSLAAALNQPTGLAIKGYHGSPHKFKEFDTAHMGTGEGGQAYGWGNYITKDPYVATTYSPQDDWMDEQLMNLYNQAERRQDYPSMEVYERYMMHERPNEVKDYLKESYADYPEDLPKRLPAQKIGENLYKKQKGSHLYEVSMEFPKEREAVDPMSIEHFLDYDKPLSEQSDYVKNILQSHDPDMYHPEGLDYDPTEKGNSILQRFGSGKEGAQKLYELGIPGTTYMGEKSKVADPEGVRNFVTYSDEVPRVVTRNMNKVKPLTNEDRLNDLENQMSAYMKTNRMPKGVDFKKGSDWFDWAYDKRDALRQKVSNENNPPVIPVSNNKNYDLIKKYLSEGKLSPDDMAQYEQNALAMETPLLQRYNVENAEMQIPDTKKRAKSIGFMTQPSKEQYHLTRNDWENNIPDLTKSDLGFHTGSIDQANYRGNAFDDNAVGQSVIPIAPHKYTNYLKINDLGSFHADSIAPQLEKKKMLAKGKAKQIQSAIDNDWKLTDQYDQQMRDVLSQHDIDAIKYANEQEGEGLSYAHINPSMIRSRFAAFDPLRKNSSSIMASGLLGDLALKYANDEDQGYAEGGEVDIRDDEGGKVESAIEDYKQLLSGYPNAEKFFTGLKDAAYRSVPTTEQMRDPNFIIDTAGLGGIIKPKGGNWLDTLDTYAGSPEKAASQFSRSVDPELESYARSGMHLMPHEYNETVPKMAVNDWLKQKLGKYIQNEMGTPEDPVRRIAEEWPAKRDVLISQQQSKIPNLQELAAKYENMGLPPEVIANRMANANRDALNIQDKISELESYSPLHYTPKYPSDFDIDEVMDKRHSAGYPVEGIAKTGIGKLWEHYADENITPVKVKYVNSEDKNRNSWLSNLSDEDRVYVADNMVGTGFYKLADELRNATRPDTDLPDFLRIDPAKLSRVSMPQAVEHVAKINAWRDAERLKEGRNAATVMHKEYPDQGLSWMQMKMPEPTFLEGHYLGEDSRGNPAVLDASGGEWSSASTPEEALAKYRDAERRDALKAALKFEGDTMGHCVGQYCDEVAGGDSNIYSLRDRRGEPHVTIETKNNGYDLNKLLDLNKQMINEDSYLTDKLKYLQENYADRPERQADLMLDTMKKYGYDYQLPEPMGKIVQIKGKQNAAPNAKYLPAVHDFVRSKDWSSVGDLQNTLLTDLRKDEKYMHPDLYKMATDKYGRFATDDEMDALRDEFYIKNEAGNKFADGGLVGGSVDAQDDEGYLDDLDRLKKAYERSNFGPNDSVIASTIHHPIEAAKRYGQHLNDMYAIATDQLTDAELAAAKDAGYDEESYPLYAMEHPIFRTDAQKAEAGMEFAGLAQTGAMPFAPESASGVLGSILRPNSQLGTIGSKREKKPITELEEGVKIGKRISTATPTDIAAKKMNYHSTPEHIITLDTMRSNPEAFEKNMRLMSEYMPFNETDTNKQADLYSKYISNNLKYFVKNAPEDFTQRSGNWYKGANALANDISNAYNIPIEASAGVLARLSPQQNWLHNVEQADRVVDIFTNHQNTVMPVGKYKGTKLKDLPDSLSQSEWIKDFDQHTTRNEYYGITPEGALSDEIVRTKTGEPSTFVWQSFPNLSRAVDILKDPSIENVSKSLGLGGHKIRNFYNNMADPFHPEDVTIDTHAGAAALFTPYSSSAIPIGHLFGGGAKKGIVEGSSKSGMAHGLYGLYADAYRGVAKDLNLPAQSLQSQIWELARETFPTMGKEKMQKQIQTNVLDELKKGKITEEEARDKILDIATKGKGFLLPDWYTQDYAKGGEVSMDDLHFNDDDALRMYHQEMDRMGDKISNTGASKKTGKGTARVNYSTLTKGDIGKEIALHTLMANYGVDVGDLNLDAGLIKPMEADGLYIGDLTGSLPLGEGRASLGVQGIHSKYDDGLSGYTAGYNGKVGDGNLSARYFEPADHNSAGRQVQLEYALPFAKGGEVKDLHSKYEESDYGYGNRPDKTKKGLGYFGELERPDGTGVMTEYSIGVPIHGEEMDVPTLVPTLTPDEIRLILHMQDGDDMPRSIVHKAIDHAHQRLSEGKPIFATEEDLYAHGGIVDVLHNDAIEQIMKAFMDSMADDEEPSAPAVSIEITTQNTETPRRGKIPKSIAREAKHG